MAEAPDLVGLTAALARLPGLTKEQRRCYRTSLSALRASRAIKAGRPVYSRRPMRIRRKPQHWRTQPRDQVTGRWVPLADL